MQWLSMQQAYDNSVKLCSAFPNLVMYRHAHEIKIAGLPQV